MKQSGWFGAICVIFTKFRSLFSEGVCVHVCMHACSVMSISWMVTHQAPLSMEFSRQKYWIGCHFLLQGILPTQGLNSHLPHWQTGSILLYHLRSPLHKVPKSFSFFLSGTFIRPGTEVAWSQFFYLVFMILIEKGQNKKRDENFPGMGMRQRMVGPSISETSTLKFSSKPVGGISEGKDGVSRLWNI